MPGRKPPKTAETTHEARHSDRYHCIAGLDEAGRGAWAGPVCAAVVCLPLDDYPSLAARLAGVYDSKALSARQRSALVATIEAVARGWGKGAASREEIDRLGIVPATRLAMSRALDALRDAHSLTPDCLLLDGMRWDDCPIACERISIPKGDRHSLSIAAASILAKTWRDALMRELDEQYSGYGFGTHKGYGTRRHAQALAELGVCPAHRLTFAPIRRTLGAHEDETR